MRPIDHRWNEQMTGILRRAAEVREARERARSSDDLHARERETAALMALIQGRAASRAERAAAHAAPSKRGRGRTPDAKDRQPGGAS